MIDYEKIGQRITEQRKHIRHISQERMAEDLGMYQADISNLEKAKNGSGINDLYKLDIIADYFGISPETLIFGGNGSMIKYHGSKMKLEHSKARLTKAHKQALSILMGQNEDEIKNTIQFSCGPYTLHSVLETQFILGKDSSIGKGPSSGQFTLNKLHTYIFLGTEVIATMVADITCVMDHVFLPAFRFLQTMIQPDILDPLDVLRTLNPYVPLLMFSENEEEEREIQAKTAKRMDELRAAGENRPVLYIESAYVREDCRQHGIFRLYIDFLRKFTEEEGIIWLNMEPTSGYELCTEYDFFFFYMVSEIGQISLNASIAEKLGFTVDPDVWHVRASTLDDDGNPEIKVVEIRKCAYYLPKAIREIIKDDGNLVAVGRAKQRLKQAKEEAEKIESLNSFSEDEEDETTCE